ncbi:D-aspartate oxidase [Leptopilina heterotoma]|uniref:D-aspartate oxidase n=1 Tax=Leptopilina heterotoma TaxID=63436 RepID=UPI001CA87DCA|nr:D-aspartate oxidase [Leptopilina heterotoma]
MKIAIVGAGVIGMTSAVAIKNAFPEANVTVFADSFTPNTTGDGSAGLWGPYVLGDTSDENIVRWAGDTHKWMEQFWKSPLALEVGISLTPIFRFTNDPKGYSKPCWVPLVYGSQELSQDELKRINKEYKSSYTGGWQFLSYTCEPTKLLPWLMKTFKSQSGKIVRRKINTLDELKREKYNVIVNCSGLGARELAKDPQVTPVRGQVSRVNASWIFHTLLEDNDGGNYIITNLESVILGGTKQKNDFSLSIREEDSKFIHDGCTRMIPALKTSEILTEWVGLRPGRPQIRLEVEFENNKNSQDFAIIHNYGHGGSGVTLCWGCALNVVEILKNLNFTNYKSKL